MVYDKEILVTKYLDIYWYSKAEFSVLVDYWSCRCVWIVLWKLKINIILPLHKKFENEST